jgi:hypothetical protein
MEYQVKHIKIHNEDTFALMADTLRVASVLSGSAVKRIASGLMNWLILSSPRIITKSQNQQLWASIIYPQALYSNEKRATEIYLSVATVVSPINGIGYTRKWHSNFTMPLPLEQISETIFDDFLIQDVERKLLFETSDEFQKTPTRVFWELPEKMSYWKLFEDTAVELIKSTGEAPRFVCNSGHRTPFDVEFVTEKMASRRNGFDANLYITPRFEVEHSVRREFLKIELGVISEENLSILTDESYYVGGSQRDAGDVLICTPLIDPTPMLDMIKRYLVIAVEQMIKDEPESNSFGSIDIPSWFEKKRIYSAEEAFAKEIRFPCVANTLYSCGLHISGDAYHWLIQGSSLPSPTFKYRSQALLSYPSLHATLREPVVTEAIDRGNPLKEALADTLSVSPSQITLLQGATITDGEIFNFTESAEFREVISLSENLPSGHRPKRGADSVVKHLRLFEYLKSASVLTSHSGGAGDRGRTHTGSHPKFTNRPVHWILSREKPVWKNEDASMDRRIHRIRSTIPEISNSFINQVLSPVVADEVKRALALELVVDTRTNEFLSKSVAGWIDPNGDGFSILGKFLFRERKIPGLVELIEHWERASGNISRMLDLDVNAKWIRLCEPKEFDLGKEKVKVVPLFTAEELINESISLNHCVSSYVKKCLFDRIHIISIRNSEGERLSTASIRHEPKLNVFDFHVTEHSGFRNGSPPKDARMALEMWTQHVRSGAIKVDWLEIEKDLQERISSRDFLKYSYDIESKEKRDLAISTWGFAFGKKEKGMSYDEWVRHHGLDIQVREALYALGLVKQSE